MIFQATTARKKTVQTKPVKRKMMNMDHIMIMTITTNQTKMVMKKKRKITKDMRTKTMRKRIMMKRNTTTKNMMMTSMMKMKTMMMIMMRKKIMTMKMITMTRIMMTPKTAKKKM